MKRLLLLVAAAGLLTATPSCKKGENDPSLSLSSRKARLAGEYSLDYWASTYTSVDPDGNKNTETTAINGAIGTRSSVYVEAGGPTTTETKAIKVDKASFLFDKDGTWEAVMNTTTTWTEEEDGFFADSYDYTHVETMKESGNWSFLGGQNDEFKNKERVVLNTLSTVISSKTSVVINYADGGSESDAGNLQTNTYVFDQGEATTVYEIDLLKKKEMVFIQSTVGSSVYSETDGALTVSYTYTNTGNTEIRLSE